MDRKPFETLARVALTLAAGRAVELPFAPGARGRDWSERFQVGVWAGDGDTCLLHTMSSRKAGVVQDGRAEPCDWSLDDMLQLLVELDDDAFTHVERGLLPIDHAGHTAQGIADFGDGPGVQMIAGTTWRRTGEAIALVKTSIGEPKWSLDEAVAAIARGR